MKKIKIIFLISFVFVFVYLAGPKPDKLTLDTRLPENKMEPHLLEQQIATREAGVKNIKPGNESRIVWYDGIKKNKTPYCIVYLHGFSASPEEGNPVDIDIARKFGCNLYLPRLYAHGLNEQEPLLEFNENDYLASAKQAIADAKNLGEKVIIMATSTGCTLALYLASGNPDFAGLILYSPNIDLHDPRSFVLTQPWGLQIARAIVGGKYYSFTGPAEMEKYWNSKYRIEALIRMKNLLQYTMKKEVFQHIKQPVLVCYYYKNEREQDDVISVPALFKMFDELGTKQSLKRKVNISNAGVHALASGIWSHDIASVEDSTAVFMDEVLHISPIN